VASPQASEPVFNEDSLPPENPLTGRVREAWANFNILSDSYEILRSVGRGDSRLEGLGAILEPMRMIVNGLFERAIRGDEIEAILADTEREIMRLERTLITVEQSLPTRVFRRRFHPHDHSWSMLTRYAEFISRHHTDDAAGRERIEVVVNRLLEDPDSDEIGALIPRDDAGDLLELLAKNVRVSDDVRNGAIGHFAATETKLAGYDDLDSIFDGGVFVDLHGLKISLGRALLDPDILYASAQLNLTLTAKLAQLAGDEPLDAIDARIEVAEQRARRVFDAEDEDAEAVEARTRPSVAPEPEPVVEEPKKKKPKKKDKWAKYTKNRKKQKQKKNQGKIAKIFEPQVGPRGKAIAAVLCLAMSFLVQIGMNRLLVDNTLVPVPIEELKTISPLLRSGGLSEGREATVMIAHLDVHRWSELALADRRVQANRVGAELEARGVRAALVMRGNVIAFQIEGGEVVFVE